MPRPAASVLLGATLVCAAHGLDGSCASAADPSADNTMRSYIVHITEFRLDDAADADVTADDLIQSFQKQKEEGALDLIGTLRLSAVEGHESSAHFGRLEKVATGQSVTPRGDVVSQHELFETGTLARVLLSRRGEGIVLNLTYEVSRLDPVSVVQRISCSTMLLVEPGKPALVGGLSGAEHADQDAVEAGRRARSGANYLIVSVEAIGLGSPRELPVANPPELAPGRSADEISRLGRADTIEAMVEVRNAMKLPGLTKEQSDRLKREFEALANHLRESRPDDGS